MKNFAFILLFFFALLGIAFGDSNCTDNDLKKVASCYKDAYGDTSTSSLISQLVKPFLAQNSTKAFWEPVCENKQKLNDCLGENRIKNCVKIEDFQKLPFIQYPFVSKFVIANFLHVDLVCEKLFKFNDDDYLCFQILSQNSNASCPINLATCDAINEGLECTYEIAYKKCGKVVGCYMQKYVGYTKCYNNLMCHACDGISAENNQVDGLCNDNEEEDTHIEVKNQISFII